MISKAPKSLLRMATIAAVAGWGLAGFAADTATHAGIDPAGIDSSVKPGDEFYLYANGAWMKTAKIPEDRSSFGSGVVLVEQANQRIRDLIQETAAANPQEGSEPGKIADYYNSFLDEAAIEAKGRAPLQPVLDTIAALHDKTGLARAPGETPRAGTDPLNNTNYHTPHLFGLWVAQDFNDPSRNTAYILQGGIGLPERADGAQPGRLVSGLHREAGGGAVSAAGSTHAGLVREPRWPDRI